MNANLKCSLFTGFTNVIVHFSLCLINHLFNS